MGEQGFVRACFFLQPLVATFCKRAITGKHAIGVRLFNIVNFFAGHVRLIEWYFH
jgi:hypothetical protein